MRALMVIIAAAWWALGCGFEPDLNSYSGRPARDGGSESKRQLEDPLVCGGRRTSLDAAQADVLILLDRSGSMKDAISGEKSKWETLTSALDTVIRDAQDRMAIGLMMFPSVVTKSLTCGNNPVVDVPIRMHNAGAIREAIRKAGFPTGMTPTAAGLLSAKRYFDQLGSSVPHYVLLATDGAPNCNETLDAYACKRCSLDQSYCRKLLPNASEADINKVKLNCLDDARTVAAVEDLAKAGIQTFVVSLPGTEAFADVLQAMADAGGRPRAGDVHYYNPTSGEEITKALASITSSLKECTFHLPEAPGDPSLVDVRLGKKSLPRDSSRQNGWDWADGQHQDIHFFGETCSQLLDIADGTELIAAFGCPPPG